MSSTKLQHNFDRQDCLSIILVDQSPDDYRLYRRGVYELFAMLEKRCLQDALIPPQQFSRKYSSSENPEVPKFTAICPDDASACESLIGSAGSDETNIA